MTREEVLDLRQKPEARDAMVEEHVPTALRGREKEARRAMSLLAALAPPAPPQALVEGLRTVRGSIRLLLLAQVLVEMGPAGRDAVAALAAEPNRRGRIALDAMHLGLSRGPLRAAIADRLRALVRNAELTRPRRRWAASHLMDGGWTSAHEDIRAAAEGDEKWQDDPYLYPDGLSAWTPPAPPTDDWLDRFPPAALQAAMRNLETTVLEAAMEVAEARDAFTTFVKQDEERDRELRRLGRNDPCPCGSGRKVKRCCLETRGWGAAARSADELVRPFRVSPHEHPDSEALLAACWKGVSRRRRGPRSPGWTWSGGGGGARTSATSRAGSRRAGGATPTSTTGWRRRPRPGSWTRRRARNGWRSSRPAPRSTRWPSWSSPPAGPTCCAWPVPWRPPGGRSPRSGGRCSSKATRTAPTIPS